jgi:hypothetical protein
MADIHSLNDIHRGVPLISRAVLVARCAIWNITESLSVASAIADGVTATGSRRPVMLFALS